MVLRCYRWSVLFRVRVARRAVRFAVCERLGPEAPVAARRVHGRLVVPCEASRDGRVELPILPKPDLSRARLTKHETNSRRTAAYRSQIDGAELARTTTTARTPAVATAPRTRSAAAQNRLHSARAAFWRRRGTRGLERHETARADAADARRCTRKVRENAQKAHRSPAAGLEPQPFRTPDGSRRSQSLVCTIND